MEKGQIVNLLPNSKRLKQVIQLHGKRFRIITPPSALPCFGGNIGVQIESLSTPRHFRNVLLEDIQP